MLRDLKHENDVADEHCGFLKPQIVIVVSLVCYIERTCAASHRENALLW